MVIVTFLPAQFSVSGTEIESVIVPAELTIKVFPFISHSAVVESWLIVKVALSKPLHAISTGSSISEWMTALKVNPSAMSLKLKVAELFSTFSPLIVKYSTFVLKISKTIS